MQKTRDKSDALRRRGVIWNMLGSAMFGASSMLLFMFVSQAIDLRTSGVFTVSFSAAQIFYMVGIFGSNHFQMTDYDGRYPFAAYRGLKVFATLLMPLAFLLAALLLRFNRERVLLTALLTLYMAICSAAELYQSMFFQKDRLDLSGRSVFFRTLLAVLAFLIVILWTRNVYYAILALIAAALFGFWCFAVRPARPFLAGTAARTDFAELKRLIADCLPLFFSVFLMDVIIACPKFAVDRYQSEEMTAIFGMVIMPVQIINLFCSFIFRPSLRVIADTIRERDRARFSRILRRMTCIVAGLSALAGVAAYWPCPEVLSLFYGTDLLSYRWEFVFVILGSGIFAMSHLLYYVLIILRKQKALLMNYCIATGIAAASAFPLARAFGVQGAIAAFAVTHAVLILLHAVSLKRALTPIFTEEESHAAV